MKSPEISVVMAARNSAGTLCRCLESLSQQTIAAGLEVIVADSSADGTGELIRTKFPHVKLIHSEHSVGLPELLKKGLEHAQGRIVAVTEPHCVFPRDWAEKLRRAHGSEFAVIGGAVENGRPDGLLSWACFFADYGAFMLPAERKVTRLLAGNHVSYKRDLLEGSLASMDDGFWKVFFHWDLERRGVHFLFDPELVAYYSRPDSVASFARRYFQHAWFFAALRSKRMPRTERLLRALTSPALPFLLLYQRVAAALGKKRNRGKVLMSIPLLGVFVLAWSAGELTGYLLGPARLPRQVYQ